MEYLRDLNNKYYSWDRKEILPFLPQKYSTVLEVGCGEGRFIGFLPIPCERWGVEIDKDAGLLASGLSIKVIIGRYNEVHNRIPSKFFDLIVCNDVIEHMEDDRWFLKNIKYKLTDNGVLVGSVPNVRFCKNLFNLLIKKDWKYVDGGVLDKTHMRHFTKKSLIRTIHKCGYDIELLEGINSITNSKSLLKNIIKILLFKIINSIFLFQFNDTQYQQFAFRIRPIME